MAMCDPGVGDARAVLQPLMLRHGFDAVERDGVLMFRIPRSGNRWLTDAAQPEHLAVSEELEGSRGAEPAPARRSWRAGCGCGSPNGAATMPMRSVEAVLPDEATHAVSQK